MGRGLQDEFQVSAQGLRSVSELEGQWQSDADSPARHSSLLVKTRYYMNNALAPRGLFCGQ